MRSSTNLLQWSNAGSIFSAVPAWVTTALGANPGDLWAPDVSYFNCQFHVYYAGSTFGSNTSVIGLATSPALDPSKSHWTDQGMVVILDNRGLTKPYGRAFLRALPKCKVEIIK